MDQKISSDTGTQEIILKGFKCDLLRIEVTIKLTRPPPFKHTRTNSILTWLCVVIPFGAALLVKFILGDCLIQLKLLKYMHLKQLNYLKMHSWIPL